ncbi:nucleoside phosphorylase domain-containing protein [Ilyonectria robusta]|uniref:nucleoside phosphorylase domain-containing protein n=1 Tax=Ilyonectria robusta TaxID=1079257 RepID=UPI001E8DB458|nr:nucleoside phosphorylase domain-containing protein [Ilyonectria robusta]KAH8688177.1 nucleoside phosphorylase domain-containing protein [Ilyonectria robusta]
MEPARPSTRLGFEIAIICALTLEADAVEALFDNYWDDENGPCYDKAPDDPNAYSTGSIGRHNVVLAYMPGMGKASSAAVAANCRASFPNVKLALVVGICGAVPFIPGSNIEVVLGDVIISSGIIEYDLGRQLPERFIRKSTLLESLGRPNIEIRALLAKLQGLRGQAVLKRKMAKYLNQLQDVPALEAHYPGVAHDKLFHAAYRHISDGKSCEECGCNGGLMLRRRFDQGVPQPAVHFGVMASGDTVMKSGKERDDIARRESVIGFEMEGAGVWDTFPCIVIKGACDYADSHKTKAWQRYAAATTAACTKAFLEYWVPSMTTGHVREQPTSPGQVLQSELMPDHEHSWISVSHWLQSQLQWKLCLDNITKRLNRLCDWSVADTGHR